MRYLHQFVGKSRLESAKNSLSRALDAWSLEWRVDHAQVSVEMRVETNADIKTFFQTDVGTKLYRVDADAPLLALTRNESWRRLVFGQDAGKFPRDPIASAMLERALGALLHRIAGTVQPLLLTAEIPAPDEGRPWIAVTLSMPAGSMPAGNTFLASRDIALRLLIDAARYNEALPNRAQAPVSLTPRIDACSRASTRLTLNFPLADISAEDLHHLQPGVVVRAAQLLSEPLNLGTPGNPGMITAFLGQHKGRKAIRLNTAARN